MQINNSYITQYTTQKADLKKQVNIAFSGTKFNPLKFSDIFIKKSNAFNRGLNSLKNIKKGEFGTICKGSIPLKPFWAEFNATEHKKLKQIGISTNADGIPRSFLKSTAEKPLSTSFVHSCSVMYLYNKNTNTHFLYHASESVPKKELKYMIENFMPEGCTHAIITPGDAYWTDVHKLSLPEMFNAIKETYPDTITNVCHMTSQYPEIVGYKGKLYEIPNRDVNLQIGPYYEDYGQASFKISDIEGFNTIDKIKYEAYNRKTSKQLKEVFSKKNWDEELKKALLGIIDKRSKTIEAIEDCKTFEEVKSLIKRLGNVANPEYYTAFYEKLKLFPKKQK